MVFTFSCQTERNMIAPETSKMNNRILVIEDEPSVADNLTYALSTEGFDPTWCPTGQQGLDALNAAPFDLVILDIGLPDRDGFDICRAIRKLYEVPIMFLTARSDEIDRILGLEIGADDYVVKPFSPREVTARVKAILRRSQPGPAQTGEPVDEAAKTSDGIFTVQSDCFRITFHEKTLELTRYEFLILETLIRRPKRIFSREALMNQVWEDPGASMERTVDAHIKSIRAKLRQVDTEADPIKTHRGLGYSLNLDS
jgi:two-component system catabolic regulation response regulator CreB